MTGRSSSNRKEVTEGTWEHQEGRKNMVSKKFGFCVLITYDLFKQSPQIAKTKPCN
jgi:hypothetical protein